MKKFAVVLIVLLGGLAATWYFLQIRPWTRYPEESPESIQRRWEMVTGWEEPKGLFGNHEVLANAAALIEANNRTVRQLLEERESAHIKRSSLPPDASNALDQLVEWHQLQGGLGPGLCQEVAKPLTLLDLGRLALATAGNRKGRPLVAAVAYLAQTLRRSGSLAHAMTGFGISEDLLVWASKPSGVIRSHCPDKQEILPVLVRDALCTYQFVKATLTGPRGQAEVDRLRSATGIPIGVGFDLERELVVLQKFLSDRLEKAHAYGGDLDRLARIVSLPEKDRLTESVLVRMTVGDLSREVRQMADVIRTCDEARKTPSH